MADSSSPVFPILMGSCHLKSNLYCGFSVVSGEHSVSVQAAVFSREPLNCKILEIPLWKDIGRVGLLSSLFAAATFLFGLPLWLPEPWWWAAGALSKAKPGLQFTALTAVLMDVALHMRFVGLAQVCPCFMLLTTLLLNSPLSLKNVCIIFLKTFAMLIS